MTTMVYNNARHLFATGQINWPFVNAHAVLLNAAYAPQPGDMFLSDIPTGAVMKDVLMTDLGETNGICFGTIPQFNAFSSGSDCIALGIYLQDGGGPGSSALVYYSDDGFGFPFTPEGFNYAVGFDQAAGGFFQA